MTGAVPLAAVAVFVGIAVFLRLCNRRSASPDADSMHSFGREGSANHLGSDESAKG